MALVFFIYVHLRSFTFFFSVLKSSLRASTFKGNKNKDSFLSEIEKMFLFNSHSTRDIIPEFLLKT